MIIIEGGGGGGGGGGVTCAIIGFWLIVGAEV